ncbi:MAG: nuclear transport factor 2 family protein [Actinomycetota bacterium]|nr:nuclear transport factor 2 family protein [Actinomycetota bacterium]
MATQDRVIASYRREMDVAEYTRIRELYKAHSTAEDARDVPGLLLTLTSDCVYEIAHTTYRWTGHTGAAKFYNELLSAFPDITFHLRNIVIGPQGVWEEADVHGTWQRPWVGLNPSGQRIEFSVQIQFPWDSDAGLFSGERIFVDNEVLVRASMRVVKRWSARGSLRGG